MIVKQNRVKEFLGMDPTLKDIYLGIELGIGDSVYVKGEGKWIPGEVISRYPTYIMIETKSYITTVANTDINKQVKMGGKIYEAT